MLVAIFLSNHVIISYNGELYDTRNTLTTQLVIVLRSSVIDSIKCYHKCIVRQVEGKFRCNCILRCDQR